MDTVGVYLRRERESKNFSLRDVSRITKISEFYLNYIEEDNFEKLPQGPYIKGYISTYSRSIGGNVAEALQLYESLNGKRKQAEAIQPEIPDGNGRRRPPEKTKARVWRQSTVSLVGKIRSSFNAVGSSAKTKGASLKAAAPQLKTVLLPFRKITSSLVADRSKPTATASSAKRMASLLKTAGAFIKTIGPSIQKKCAALPSVVAAVKKTASTVTANRWLTQRRTWLYACAALFGAGILVLTGSGLYRLLIDDGQPPTAADLQISQDQQTSPLPATGAAPNALPPISNPASVTSAQLEENSLQKEPLRPLNRSAVQQRPSSVPSSPEAAVPRVPSSGAAETADPNSASSLGSPLPTGNTASSRSTAGKSSSPPAVQSGMAAIPSPGPTTAADDPSVLTASICSEIKNRMPAGVDTSFPASVQRVYVWSLIETKQVPAKIRHIYYFEGQAMSDVTLNVRSSHWRTWSYKSISNIRYQGQWRVDITAADGKVLRRLYFEVK